MPPSPAAPPAPEARSPSFEGAVAFAQELIRIPSLSGKEGLLAQRVVREMEALGYDEARIDALGSPVGLIRGRGGDAPPVMLSAHADMVAEGDWDEWEHPPFAGVVADGWLHGRGAMDIKGPLAIQTHVAAALRGRMECDLIVAHPVFEERGGWGMDELTCPNHGEGLPGDMLPGAVIIGESTNGDIAIGHRGRAEIEVVAHGKAGHASAPSGAVNTLDAVPAILAGVDALARDQERDPVLGPASVVATGIHATPASLNVVPDRVVATLDWRILPADTEEDLLDRVRNEVEAAVAPSDDWDWRFDFRLATERQRTWTGVEEDRRILSPGFLMDRDHPVVVAAARAVGVRNAHEEPARVRPWTFATDGGWTRGVRGVPTIGFAPGLERHAHTNRERLELTEARWAYDRYLALVPAVADALREA